MIPVSANKIRAGLVSASKIAMRPIGDASAPAPTPTAIFGVDQAVGDINLTVTTDGAAYSVDWGDGNESTDVTSGAEASNTYSSAFNGQVRIYTEGEIEEISSTEGGWNFSLSALPSSVKDIAFTSANTAVIGSLGDLQEGIETVELIGDETTITGGMGGAPSTLAALEVPDTNSVITTSLDDLQNAVSVFNVSGTSSVITPGSGLSVTSMEVLGMRNMGLSSSEVDDLIPGVANQTAWSGDAELNIDGTNEPRTAASDADVSTLEGNSVTVNVNEPYSVEDELFSSGEDGHIYDFKVLASVYQDTGKVDESDTQGDPIALVVDQLGTSPPALVNLLLWSHDPTNAVWTQVGAGAPTVVDQGGGVPRITWQAGNGNLIQGEIPFTPEADTDYTATFRLRVEDLDGSAVDDFNIRIQDDGGTLIENPITLIDDGSFHNYSVTGQTATPSGDMLIFLRHTGGANSPVIDFEWAQLEEGSSFTSIQEVTDGSEFESSDAVQETAANQPTIQNNSGESDWYALDDGDDSLIANCDDLGSTAFVAYVDDTGVHFLEDQTISGDTDILQWEASTYYVLLRDSAPTSQQQADLENYLESYISYTEEVEDQTPRVGIVFYSNGETGAIQTSGDAFADDRWVIQTHPDHIDDTVIIEDTSPIFEGTRSIKLAVDNAHGQWTANNTYRTELKAPSQREWDQGDEVWEGFSFFMADTADNQAFIDSDKINRKICQWHNVAPFSGTGGVDLRNGNLYWDFGGELSERVLATMQLGVRIDLIFHYIISDSDDGLAEVWIQFDDGGYTKVVEELDTATAPGSVDHKIGFYFNVWPDGVTYVEGWFGAFRVGDDTSDFSSVEPGSPA